MENFFPIIGSLISPTITYKYVLLRNPPKVDERILLPLFIYILFLLAIGLVTFAINMKRLCPSFNFRRMIEKVIIYVFITMILFLIINYYRWPIIYWLNLFQTMEELTIVGIFLAICSQFSYYLTKLIHSNC